MKYEYEYECLHSIFMSQNSVQPTWMNEISKKIESYGNLNNMLLKLWLLSIFIKFRVK